MLFYSMRIRPAEFTFGDAEQMVEGSPLPCGRNPFSVFAKSRSLTDALLAGRPTLHPVLFVKPNISLNFIGLEPQRFRAAGSVDHGHIV